jgi:hypothetical protein
MHVHTDVDIVHEVTPATNLELLPVLVSVQAADDDLALAERVGPVLPATRERAHLRRGLEREYRPLGDEQLRCLGEEIDNRRADQAV